MGIQPPFLYDAIKSEGQDSPYRQFDPKAVSRASVTPKPPRPKHDGPLVSFNQHPDSYFVLPTGNPDVKPMNASVKKYVKWTRIIQLVLRCLEMLSACGVLVMSILLRGFDTSTGWIMRIASGVAILHTVYGIYHLGRKPSGRTPASSASYMLFASFFDVSIIPCYALIIMVARAQTGWTTILSNGENAAIFSKVLFILATVGASLHLASLALSLYLAVTFRKITKMPPDMNPLEDNLTSRHKRAKSTVSTAASSNMSEKRLSAPLESKRSSGAAYEDLSRPPTIPFFHTRTQSTTSFSTYRSTPPPSADGHLDLPSRQYQVESSPGSARSSMAGSNRNSAYAPSSSTKRSSYTPVPMSEDRTSSPRSSGISQLSSNNNMPSIWTQSESLPSKSRSQDNSPSKAKYQPIHKRQDSLDDHPNPLELNPPTPRLLRSAPNNHRHSYVSESSPLSEISNNSRNVSGDIGDHPLQSSAREVVPRQLKEVPTFKAKYYGNLKSGTPPIMIGRGGGLAASSATRQVSSGNDYGQKSAAASKGLGRREVSGKVAEEGRGGEGSGWGTRFGRGSVS